MKRLFTSRLFVGFLVFLFAFCQSLLAYAAFSTASNAFAVNPDYLISTGSNADPYRLMTLDLGDDDYISMSSRSSVGSVVNTVDFDSDVYFSARLIDSEGREYSARVPSDCISGSVGGLSVKYAAPVGSVINGWYLYLKGYSRVYLPPVGVYDFSADLSSEFSVNYDQIIFWTSRGYDNAQAIYSEYKLHPHMASGDFYIAPVTIDIKNCTYFTIDCRFENTTSNLDQFLRVRFDPSSKSPVFSTAGSGNVDADYQSDVSGSLSNISSSIGDMSESLDSAAENLEYISTSQNLIIQGIDNVIMHISDQLYAFWDQLYNLIHEPTYARLGDILDAIRNLDLEITVEMTEVTNAVNKMNQDVQNKLQQTTDKITGGFDNAVMESEATKLDNSISEYDEAEQSVIQNVNDSLDNFEFDAELGEYQSIVSVISDFLQELYDSSGGFKVLINLSMLLSLAGIVIGIYRFGGGS